MELVMVRVAIIDRSKELPADMMEAITSLIYAAQVPSGAPPYASSCRSTDTTRWHIRLTLDRQISVNVLISLGEASTWGGQQLQRAWQPLPDL